MVIAPITVAKGFLGSINGYTTHNTLLLSPNTDLCAITLAKFVFSHIDGAKVVDFISKVANCLFSLFVVATRLAVKVNHYYRLIAIRLLPNTVIVYITSVTQYVGNFVHAKHLK